MPLPILTERLLLRPVTMDDLPAYEAVFGDPLVMRYISNGATRSREDLIPRILRMIDTQDRLGMSLWAVERRDTGEVIGDCGLIPIAHRGPEIEVGYRLARAHWGMGFATEAASAALRYGFDECDLDRIIAVTEPGNAASRRVLTKIGMMHLGQTDEYYNETLELFGMNAPGRAP